MTPQILDERKPFFNKDSNDNNHDSKIGPENLKILPPQNNIRKLQEQMETTEMETTEIETKKKYNLINTTTNFDSVPLFILM